MTSFETAAPVSERRAADVEGKRHDDDGRGHHAVNASGHADQLPRQYSLLAICATALTIDNAWVVVGGSAGVAIANGGPPGVLYELLTACSYYLVVGLCLAELASALPTAGGVYHWATVTAGRRGGFIAGHLGWWGWMFGLASIVMLPANMCVQMYALLHPEFVQQPWHMYLAYVLVTWFCVALNVWGNRVLPALHTAGLLLICLGGPATIIVLAVVPRRHASSASVWKEWENTTGWTNAGAFIAGTLNGAFTIGTPDSVTHMAEELPHPRRDMPRAIMAQLIIGSISAFAFAIALMYAITDLDAVLNAPGGFPLAIIYLEATGSPRAAVGLMTIVLLSILICSTGITTSLGRNLWALARDGAVPFSSVLAQCDERRGCPIWATIVNGLLVTAVGAITLGSKVAFNDLAGSFIILTSVSQLICIASNVFTGRVRLPVSTSPFSLGKLGLPINLLAMVLITLFVTVFCLPYSLPVTPTTMNYNSVILVGLTLVTVAWWFVVRDTYRGPNLRLSGQKTGIRSSRTSVKEKPRHDGPTHEGSGKGQTVQKRTDEQN
ncbi:putative amino acid transporter [Auriculariales sp. MPI-PUGE-AT-0066]|nr:putative amino acid transporter [Auriculariales sp. MPI-PUGE-AT-0066]